MHTHAVDDMQVALRHSCRRQCLPYAGVRFAQDAELLDPAESWEQGGFIPPPMSRGAIPQVAREFRVQFESHHPAEDLSFQRFVAELQGNAFRFVQSKRQ